VGANYFSVGGRTFTVKKSPEGEIVMANIRPGGGIIPVNIRRGRLFGGDPIIVHRPSVWRRIGKVRRPGPAV